MVCKTSACLILYLLYDITITANELDITCYESRYLFTSSSIYPAMTAFTDQYSLPNIFFDIGQL